jgi:hypothetical protein
MPRRSRKPREPAVDPRRLLLGASVALAVLGLCLLVWGALRFYDPPLPLANTNSHRYSTSRQLARISGALSSILLAWMCYRYSRSDE